MDIKQPIDRLSVVGALLMSVTRIDFYLKDTALL